MRLLNLSSWFWVFIHLMCKISNCVRTLLCIPSVFAFLLLDLSMLFNGKKIPVYFVGISCP